MIQGEQEDRSTDPRMKLRPNTGDKLHALRLLRDVAIINARTVRERGLLPPGVLPAHPKRKPDLPHPSESLSIKEDEMNPLQKIAATTALAASTLAACGKAHPPESPAEAAPVRAPTPVAEVPTLPAPNVPPVATPEPVTDVAKPEIKRGPAIPAATLRKQILALLGSLQGLETMEHEHVEAIFNVPLTKNPEVRDGYDYFGSTTEGWNYRIAVTRWGELSEPPTITIYLHKGYLTDADQGQTYCSFDFEALAGDIVALGYERAATRSTFGAKPSWGFGRDVPIHRTGFGVGVYLYYLDEGTESERACVSWLQISGGPRDD